MKKISKQFACILVCIFGLLAVPAYAVTDYSSLTNAVTFSEVTVAILATFGVIVGFYVILKGARFILHAVKGA